MQVALFLGGGLIWPPTEGHFRAPIVEGGFPIGLRFVTIDQWLDLMANTAAHMPILSELECYEMGAMMETPCTRHLGDINVPVLGIGNAGGGDSLGHPHNSPRVVSAELDLIQ